MEILKTSVLESKILPHTQQPGQKGAMSAGGAFRKQHHKWFHIFSR